MTFQPTEPCQYCNGTGIEKLGTRENPTTLQCSDLRHKSVKEWLSYTTQQVMDHMTKLEAVAAAARPVRYRHATWCANTNPVHDCNCGADDLQRAIANLDERTA